MIFSERVKLSKEFALWRDKNNVSDDAFGVIMFLDAKGLLKEPEREELMNNHIVDVNKKVQMTREQFSDLYHYTFSGNKEIAIERARQHGYILPDPVEEAEELFNEYTAGVYSGDDSEELTMRSRVIDKLWKAHNIMKPYYEKARSDDGK